MFKKSVLLSLILTANVATAATTITITGKNGQTTTSTTTDFNGGVKTVTTSTNAQGETATIVTTGKEENTNINNNAKGETVMSIATVDEQGVVTTTTADADGGINVESGNSPAPGNMAGNGAAVATTTRRPYFKSHNPNSIVPNGSNPPSNEVAGVAMISNRQSTPVSTSAPTIANTVSSRRRQVAAPNQTTHTSGDLAALATTASLATVATPFTAASAIVPTAKQKEYSKARAKPAKTKLSNVADKNTDTTGVAGIDDFSSEHNASDRADQFLVPRSSADGFIKPQTQLLKTDGSSFDDRMKSDVGHWQTRKHLHENNITVKHTGYPLHVSALQLVGEPQDVKLDTQALLAPYHGVIQNRNDLMTLAAAVNQAYLAHGIVLASVMVPQQKNNGTVVMNVSFQRIQETALQGDTGKTGSWMQYYLDQMKAVYPIQKAAIEHYTLLMDQLPGVSINNYVQPILDDNGQITGITEIADSTFSPVTGYIALSNGNSDFVGPYLLQGGMTWNQPTGPDSLSIDAAKSAPVANELTYYDFKYSRFLTKNDLQLDFFYSHVDTQPGGIYDTYNLKGEGDTFTTTLTQPWILTRDLRFSNSISLTTTRANSIYNTFGLESYNDKLTTVNLATDLGFRQGNSWNQATLTFSMTGPWLGAQSNPSDPSVLGYNGRSFATQLALTRTQYFTDNFSLLAGLTGQYTHSTVAGSQLLGYGGALYGRAFTDSGFSGSNGYIGRLQANYNLRGVKPSLSGITPYAFYDMGELYDQTNALAVSERYAASSTGIGVSSAFAKHWYLNTYAAKPVSHNQNVTVDTSVRWIFSVVGNF